MTFLVPAGLVALATLPIIVLLHLIQRRRVRQRVPSLELWRSLESEIRDRKPHRLPFSLLLLLHLLLAALLAFALGQPLLRLAFGRVTHLAIIVDTSSSMAATDGQPDRLADAKATVRDLLADTGRNDSVALIELSAEPRVVAQATGSDTVVLLDPLDRLKVGGPDGKLDRALALAQATAQPRSTTRVVVLTDLAFQATATQPVAGEVEWRTFGGEGDNAAIVAFAARPQRDGSHQLYARVANYGVAATARTLELSVDNEIVASEPVRLGPGAEAEWSWPLPAGSSTASAALSGADVQPLDDRAYALLDSATSRRVLLVSDRSIALERALRAQPGVQVHAIAPDSYQPRDDVDLFVFVGYVPDVLPAAPVLLIAPPTDQSLVDVGGTGFSLQADQINDPRFAVIDWRPVIIDRVDQLAVPTWAEVAVAAGETPLVLTGQRNGHAITIWAFDPDNTNLANRVQFPLLTATTIELLGSGAHNGLAVGDRAPQELQAEDGRTIATGERITVAGIYQSAMGVIAVNALDADESHLQSRPAAQITTVAQPPVDGETLGREVWQPLIGAALLVLIAEWLYVNRRHIRQRANMVAGTRSIFRTR